MYVKNIVPENPKELPEFLNREFSDIENEQKGFITRDGIQFNTLKAPPPNPTNGLLVYADGIDWNPGLGEGFYGYTNGGWNKI